MALLRVAKQRGRYWPVRDIPASDASYQMIPIIRARCYALRMIGTDDLMTYRCHKTKQVVVARHMTRVEAAQWAADRLGENWSEFVEIAELNAAGGIVE